MPPSRGRNGFRPAFDSALALADGRIFRGTGFGARTDSAGEAVFTTVMTGYQEVCTDPSFRGQIVCMTYPLIGNYGIDPSADQSRRPWIAGLVVREHCTRPSNWNSVGTIDDYLIANGIPGLSGVDTRALTRHIRTIGDSRAALVTGADELTDSEIVDRARTAPLPGERDVVGEVISSEIAQYGAEGDPHIVIVDCGVKQNIIVSLLSRGAKITVVPYGTPWEEIQQLRPEGVVVSPGPGDPANLDQGLDVVESILEAKVPYFGICLGHQLLARAIGADTAKLKFGHRGGNHPVVDTRDGTVSITSQNHGFYVKGDSFSEGAAWGVAMRNLNDDTVEGLFHRDQPVISVQFHPEASPGPTDSGKLFDEFLRLVARERTGQ